MPILLVRLREQIQNENSVAATIMIAEPAMVDKLCVAKSNSVAEPRKSLPGSR
jgi:hypothetical protein